LHLMTSFLSSEPMCSIIWACVFYIWAYVFSNSANKRRQTPNSCTCNSSIYPLISNNIIRLFTLRRRAGNRPYISFEILRHTAIKHGNQNHT
jgi:hypothetical protein